MKRNQVPYQTFCRIRLSLPNMMTGAGTPHEGLYSFLGKTRCASQHQTNWDMTSLLPMKISIICPSREAVMRLANWVERWAKKHNVEFTFGSD